MTSCMALMEIYSKHEAVMALSAKKVPDPCHIVSTALGPKHLKLPQNICKMRTNIVDFSYCITDSPALPGELALFY